jgi:NodT family efflux transporter outer membrane factor (OMF) lipoprotein|tara:strand:- start:6112 stop:7557 length:1446 start_codon:yes stop_codon:yes gene_type:complete
MLLALGLLSGCATGAPPRAADITLPAVFTKEALGGPATETLGQFWTLYDDPQLAALTETALQQGFSVREALARLDEARALRSVAIRQFDPQGSLQANTDYRETQDLDSNDNPDVIPGLPPGFDFGTGSSVGATKSASVTLPVSWELDLFGRRGAARRQGDADLAAAAFEVESARAAIAAEVARSLFQARGFAAQLEEAEQTLRIQRELLRILSIRAERGIAAMSEADRVAGDVAQAEAQVADLTAAITASKRALLAIVGTATATLDSVAVTSDLDLPPTIPATMPGDLLERRPDVRIASARVASAASGVRLAELDFFPRLTLNPGVGLSVQRGSFDSTTSFWSLAAGFAVPILDRGRLMAQLRAEGARAEQAVLAYERTVQTAFSESDQALVRLAADRRRVDLLDAGQVRARQAYDAALTRYELGFADLQEVLDAERAWRATRASLTTARVDALQRSVQLFQSLGGGWSVTPPVYLARNPS